MRELYSGLDFLVTEQDGRIEIEQRNQLGPVIGLGSLLLAGAVYGASHWAPPAYAMLMTWFAALMGLLGFLNLSLSLRGPRRSRLDPAAGTASVYGRLSALSEVSAARIESTSIGSSTFFSLVVTQRGKNRMLMTLTSRQPLEPVLQAVAATLQQSDPSVVVPGESFLKAFLPPFLLLLGMLWALVGFFTMPDVILGRHGSGVLLWPLGIWIAGLGILEWLGVPLSDAVLNYREGGSRMTWIGLIWFASYAFICWR